MNEYHSNDEELMIGFFFVHCITLANSKKVHMISYYCLSFKWKFHYETKIILFLSALWPYSSFHLSTYGANL